MRPLLKIILWTATGIASGVISVYLYWWLVSLARQRAAETKGLPASSPVLWRDPGAIEYLDLSAGAGGPQSAPAPPFTFLEEHGEGSNPCISVNDANGRIWRVKWGDEVKSETFVSRLVWAAGYFVEQTFFIPEGRIEELGELGRARDCLGSDCTFVDARFELDDRSLKKHFDEKGWSWDDNPFLGTRELAGLRILTMLTSNWDNKDVRDVARGSNTAIFDYRDQSGKAESRYLIIDWGASMGRWGSPLTRTKWDHEGFAEQTPDFVTGIDDNGYVIWGYVGQRTDEARERITREDVQWLCRYLTRVSDAQIQNALRAAGASDQERVSFGVSIRSRIDRLNEVAEGRG